MSGLVVLGCALLGAPVVGRKCSLVACSCSADVRFDNCLVHQILARGTHHRVTCAVRCTAGSSSSGFCPHDKGFVFRQLWRYDGAYDDTHVTDGLCLGSCGV